MLFKSLVPSLLNRASKEFKWDASLERRMEAQKRLDYYHDDQLDELTNLLRRQFVKYEALSLQPVFDNVVRHIIDTISVVYAKPPLRRIDRESDNALYERICREARLDMVMAALNRYANLLKTVILKVSWRRGGIAFDILTPANTDVIQREEDPTVAQAVIYDATHRFDSPHLPAEDIASIYWDEERLLRLDYNRRVVEFEGRESVPNPVGDLKTSWAFAPFVVMRPKLSLDRFWMRGGEDLVSAQDTINVKLTELNHLLKMQSFSIPVAVGYEGREPIVVDPSEVIEIPLGQPGDAGQPDFRFETPNPRIREVRDCIRDMVIRIAERYHLSPSNFSLTGSVQSGLSLKIQNFLLLEDRRMQIPLWVDYEREVFEVVRALWNVSAPPEEERFSTESEIEVSFAEMDYPDDPLRVHEVWERRIQLGVTSAVEYLMALNPRIKDKAEAERIIRENRSLLHRLDEVGTESNTTAAPEEKQ